MKKLMLTVAAVAMASCAMAASVQWKTTTTGKLYEAGSSTLVSSATAYLIDVASYGQADLAKTFFDGKFSTVSTLSSASVASGVIAATYVDGMTTSGQSATAYIAVILGDSIYISDTKTLTVPGTGNSTVQYALATSSKAAATEFANVGSFAGAGWYSAPVPEPTSGLLLLLGMAGLALKRKRA